MRETISVYAKRAWLVTADAFFSFRKNDDLRASSSLAFSAMLALIPALFLITILLGVAVGSSQKALLKTQEIANELIPRYSSAILREVQYITTHTKTIGILNIIVLFWTITPLVSGMRATLNTIFRASPGRSFFLEKIFDVTITVVVVIGFTGIAVSGIIYSFAAKLGLFELLPGYLAGLLPFLFLTAAVAVFYAIFSKRVPFRHLAIGALVAAALWVGLRPVFNLFFAYNPGYGLAFGSFKSLFIVIIWIYYSLAVFLFGAEIAASFNREDLILMKKLIDRVETVPAPLLSRFSIRFEPGSIIFREGDPGDGMFLVLKGDVQIEKDGKKIAVIVQGSYFGEMSFLLSEPRSATAIAVTRSELLVINNKTVLNLIREYPEIVFSMLREMAVRLRETNKLIA